LLSNTRYFGWVWDEAISLGQFSKLFFGKYFLYLVVWLQKVFSFFFFFGGLETCILFKKNSDIASIMSISREILAINVWHFPRIYINSKKIALKMLLLYQNLSPNLAKRIQNFLEIWGIPPPTQKLGNMQ
jgi:hypothetical protein